MPTLKSVAASALMLVLVAMVGPVNAAEADDHAAHHPDKGSLVQAAPAPAMQDRMKAMREMHQKMMNAKTPADRQALMGDQMKFMQEGMQMMKGMMAMGEGMGEGKTMPGDMDKRQQMMEGCMEMMQMMMEMLMAPPSNVQTSR